MKCFNTSNGTKDHKRKDSSINKINGYLVYPLCAFDTSNSERRKTMLRFILRGLVFGTIASIKAFHDNQLLYQLFYNLPYALVALTIPITLYDALVVYRYRLNQPSMIAMSIGVSTIILIGGLLFADTAWLGLSCWLGVAFLFKVSFKRFYNFLEVADLPDIDEVLETEIVENSESTS